MVFRFLTLFEFTYAKRNKYRVFEFYSFFFTFFNTVFAVWLVLSVKPPVEAPKNIEFIAVSPSTVTVRFNGVADGNANGVVTGYMIYYQPIGGLFSNEIIRKVNISSSRRTVTVRGLEENVVYRFWMTASNSGGEGPSSKRFTVRTQAGTRLFPFDFLRAFYG